MSCTVTHEPGEFCHDQATPAQREAFAFLFGHAYDYAAQGGDRDAAESYAAYYAGRHWAEPDEAPAHPDEFERWRTRKPLA